MNAWDEKPDPNAEITDLETARLALRGALQSARNLQDLNSELKGQLQDFLHREKALNERMILLQKELNECYRRLDEQAALGTERDVAERDALRKEIAAEQNQKLQAEMAALAQSVENWAEIRREKETELSHLKAALLQKESEVFALQKEKISQEEKSHRDMLDVMAKSRTSIYDAVETAVKPKEAEIQALKEKIDTQDKDTAARLQAMASEVRLQEQHLLEEFRKRQQNLEVEHTKRERELWEHTQNLRASLEEQLKSSWNERLKTVEHDYNSRRGVLESDWRQKEKELNERWLLREADLHRQWTDKETAIARDWMAREKSLLEEFQKQLDQERLRASTEITDIKSKNEVWRTALEGELHRKEMEFNRRHQDAQEGLRATWRRREEELLAKHQEISEKAQRALAEAQARYLEKEGANKALLEKIATAERDRAQLADRLAQVQRDAAARSASLEEQVRLRDQELETQVAQSTARDEERASKITHFQRELTQRESDVKMLEEQVRKLEGARAAALAQAVALQSDFDRRHQELETAARAEIAQLRTQLTTLAQGSTEREQEYHRRVIECETLLVQRESQIKGMDEQLSLARKAVQDLTDKISAQDADYAHRNTALQERLLSRESELVADLQALRTERDEREEGLRHKLIALQNDLAERQQEFKALEDHFLKTESRREDAETRVEALLKQVQVLRQESAAAAQQHQAESTEAAQQAAEVRSAFERRILELESEIRRHIDEGVQLQDRLSQLGKDRETDNQASALRESRWQEKAIYFENTVKEQDVQWNQRLTALEREHLQNEAEMQKRLLDFEADVARRIQNTEELNQRLEKVQAVSQDWESKHDEARQLIAEQERLAEAERQTFATQLNEFAKVADAAKEKAAQQLRAMESDLRQRETLIGTLRDERLQGQKALEALAEEAAWTEKALLEKVQYIETRMTLEQKEYETLLSAARQQNVESAEDARRQIQDLEVRVQHTGSELALAQTALAQTQKDHAALLAESTKRETSMTERIQGLEDRLRSQKEQMVSKVASVERERLLSEEALHTKMLDIEERLVQKTGTAKMLQERLTRAENEKDTLEKKVGNLEQHVSRLEQQLKNKEVEFQTAVANAQKEQVDSKEAHQRKVLEMQKVRQLLESELVTARESLTAAGDEKKRVDRRVIELQNAMAETQSESLKQVEAQRTHILKLESDMQSRDSAIRGLQEQISIKDEKNAEVLRVAAAEKKKLETANEELDLALKTVQADFEKRWAKADEDHAAVERAQSERIRQLQDDMRNKEASLQTLTDQLHQLEDVRLHLEERGKQESLETTRQREALAARWKDEQERVRTLTAQVVTYTAQLKTLEGALATSRAESETLSATLEAQRVRFANEFQAQQTTHADLQASLKKNLETLEAEWRALMKQQTEESSEQIDLLQARGRDLEKALAERLHALQDLQGEKQLLLEERDRLLAWQAEGLQDRARWEAQELERSKVHDALQAQILDLQSKLATRENDLKMLQHRLAQSEAAHRALEKDGTERRSEWVAQRDALQARLLAEQDKAYQLEQALTAKGTELRELHVSWTAAQQEHKNDQAAQASNHQRLDELQKTLGNVQKELSDRDRYIARLRSDIARQEEEQTLTQSQLDAQLRAHQTQADMISAERVAWAQEKELLKDEYQELKSDFEKRLVALQRERAAAEETLHNRLVTLQDQLSRRETELQSIQLHDVAELKAALEVAAQERERLLKTLAREQEEASSTLQQHEHQTAEALAAAHARMKDLEKDLRDRLAAAEVEAAARLAVLQKRVLDLEREVSARDQAVSGLEESLQSALEARDRLSTLLSQNQSDQETSTQMWSKERDAFTQQVAALEDALMAQRQEWSVKLNDVREKHRLVEQGLLHKQNELQAELDRRLSRLNALDDSLKRSQSEHLSLKATSTQSAEQWALDRKTLEGQLSTERQHLGDLQSAFSLQASELTQLRDRLVVGEEDRQKLKSALAGQQEKYLAQVKRYEESTVQREADWQEAMDLLEKEWRTRVEDQTSESQARAEALQKRSAELERDLGMRDVQLRRLEDDLRALQEGEQRQQAVLSSREAALKETTAQRDRLTLQMQEMERRMAAQRLEWDKQAAQLHDERHALETGLYEKQAALESTLQEKVATIESLRDALERAQAAHDQFVGSTQVSAKQWSEERTALDAALIQERKRLGELQGQLTLQTTDMKALRDLLVVAEQERERVKGALTAQQERYLAQIAGLEKKGTDRETQWKLSMEALDVQWRKRLDEGSLEAAKRADALNRRAGELEKAIGARDTQIHQLTDQLTALQEHERRQQGLLASREAALQDTASQRDALAVRLQSIDQAFTAQRLEWEKKTAALRDEHREAQAALDARQVALQAELDQRLLDLQTTTETLRQAEAAHQTLSGQSAAAQAQWTQERQTLEKKLHAERLGLRDLQGVVAHQAAQIEDLKALSATADQDRQRLKAALTEQQEKYLQQVSHDEEQTFQLEAHWKEKLEAHELEWRSRVDEISADAKSRVDGLLARAAELEHQMGLRETERLRLEDQVHALQDQDRRQQALLVSRESALKETTSQRDALAERLQTMDQAFAAQRLDWEKRANVLRDEHRQAQAALESRQETLQAELNQRVLDLQATSDALRQAEAAHHALSGTSSAAQAQWALERQTLEQKLNTERLSLRDLQALLAHQAAQIEDLKAAAVAADQDRQRLKAALTDQQEKYLAQVAHDEEQTFQLESRWKEKLEAHEMEWRERIEVVSADAKTRVDALLARATELEHQMGLRETERLRLEDQVHALQDQDHRQQALLSSRESALQETASQRDALAARLQAMDQAYTAQRLEWEKKTNGLRDEHRMIQSKLESKQETLQAELDQRLLDLQDTSERLRQAEAAHHTLSGTSEAAYTLWAQERQALEKKLNAERLTLRDLQSVSAHQAAQIQELKALSASADQDRQRLKAALSEQQERYLAQVAQDETHAFQISNEWREKLEAQEREWRERVDTVTAEAQKRVEAILARAVELEHQVGVRETERLRLEDQVRALQDQDRRHQDVLSSREEALRDTMTQRDALASQLRALEHDFAGQRAEWDRAASLLRDEHLAAQEALEQQQTRLQAELQQRAAELQSSEEALKRAEEAHRQVTQMSNSTSAQWAHDRQQLENTLQAERLRLRDLQSASALQSAQVQELKGLLSTADQDRQRLKAGLTEQQQKYLSAVARHEEMSSKQEADSKAVMERLESDWRARLEATNAESAKRVQALQERSAALEAQLGTLDAERRQLEDMVHTLQEQDVRQAAVDDAREKALETVSAERDGLAEKLLEAQNAFAAQRLAWEREQAVAQEQQRAADQQMQKRLAALQKDLSGKASELTALEQALNQARAAYASMETQTAESAAAWEQERGAFESRLLQERQALLRVQGDLDHQTSQWKEVQQAVTVANADRERLKKALAAQQERYLARVAQEETTAAQQSADAKKALDTLEAQWRQRLEATQTDARHRTEQLEQRLSGLEEELNSRQNDLQSLQSAFSVAESERRRLEHVVTERQNTVLQLQQNEAHLLQQLDAATRRAQALSDDVHLRTQTANALEKRLAEDEKTRTRLQVALNEQSAEKTRLRDEFEARLAKDHQLLKDLETRQAEHLQDLHNLRREVATLSEERSILMDRMSDQAEHFQTELAKRDSEAIAHEAEMRVQAETAEKDAQERMARWISESDQRVAALQARRQDLERLVGEKEIELRSLRDRFEKIDEERQRLAALDASREQSLQELKARERDWLKRQETLDRKLVELENLTSTQAEQVLLLKGQLSDREMRLRDTETRASKADHDRSHLEHELLLAQRHVQELRDSTAAFEAERKSLLAQLDDQRVQLLKEGSARDAQLENGQREWHERLAALDQEWRERAERLSHDAAERTALLQKRLVDLEHQLDERTAAGQALTEQLDVINAEAARVKNTLTEREQSLDQARKAERLAQKRAEETQRRLISLESERVAQEKLMADLRLQFEGLERSVQASAKASSDERERLEKELLRRTENERTLGERLEKTAAELDRRSQDVRRLNDQLNGLKTTRDELEKSLQQNVSLTQARQEFEERWSKEKRHAHELQEQVTAQSVRLKDLQESLALATQKMKADAEALEQQKAAFAEQMETLRHRSSEQHSALSRTITDLEEQLSRTQKAQGEQEDLLEKRCAALQEQVVQQAARVQTLESQLQSSERDRAYWDKTLSEGQSSLDQERRHWQTRLTEERQKSAQMERELALQREKLLDVQQQASKADADRKTLAEHVQTLKDRMNAVDRQTSVDMESLQQRAADLELLSAERQGEIDARQKQISDLQGELQRMEGLLNDKKGNLAKHRQALENEFKQRTQALERKAKEEDASRRREWERKEREIREEHTADMERAQASFLTQLQSLRDESEQALSRLQGDALDRASRGELKDQLDSARAQLDQQKQELNDQRRRLEERAKKMSEREQEMLDARAGADELRDKMVSALQTGDGRSANASMMQSLLEEWVFGFAHQVRNPMGIIRSISETLLQSAKAKSAERQSLVAIVKAVDGLNHRLAEFIEFAKPVRPVTKPVLLPQSWDRVMAALKDRFERQRITVQTHWPDPLPLLLLDPEHLHTILCHLTANALDASSSGSALDVSATYDRRAHLLQIRLTDRGAGIRPEHLKEAGKPFFTTKTAAAGLGLALTKRLLRAYEGDLKIEPASPQGTTVTVRLYAQEGEATAWAA